MVHDVSFPTLFLAKSVIEEDDIFNYKWNWKFWSKRCIKFTFIIKNNYTFFSCLVRQPNATVYFASFTTIWHQISFDKLPMFKTSLEFSHRKLFVEFELLSGHIHCHKKKKKQTSASLRSLTHLFLFPMICLM